MSVTQFIKKKILAIYMIAFEYFGRYKWLQKTYKGMIDNYSHVKPLSKIQQKELKKIWGGVC